MKFKTWHYELVVVGTVLCLTTLALANNWINWITTIAVIFTFQHAQIADRLQERQAKMDKPTVECYHKLSKFFMIKEFLWIVAFISMENFAAIIGSLMFGLYPAWRRYYRSKIKPLSA